MNGGAFLMSPYTAHELPDIQFTVFPRNVETNEGQAISVSVTLNRPTTRGAVKLRSANPDDTPVLPALAPSTQSDV